MADTVSCEIVRLRPLPLRDPWVLAAVASPHVLLPLRRVLVVFPHFHASLLIARLDRPAAATAHILFRYLEAREYIGGLLLCNQGCVGFFFFSTAESWNRLDDFILLKSELYPSQLELSLWTQLFSPSCVTHSLSVCYPTAVAFLSTTCL